MADRDVFLGCLVAHGSLMVSTGSALSHDVTSGGGVGVPLLFCDTRCSSMRTGVPLTYLLVTRTVFDGTAIGVGSACSPVVVSRTSELVLR